MKIFLLVCLALLSSSVLAATTPYGIPKNLHVYSESGSTFVDLVAYDCSSYRYYIKNDHIRYDAILSILLAAQLAKKEVRLRFNSCNSANQGEIVGIYLK